MTAKETRREKIIIDTDPGIDDALALLLLLQAPEVEVLAVTTVAGNKDLQTVNDNAATILAQVESTVPLYSGAAAPLARELVTGQVMGESGLGNVERITGIELDGQAVTKIIELVLANPGEVSLLAIGPLTNVALALKQEPELAQKLKQLVIMGGAIEAPGNKSRVAEFNFFVDPEAAQIVLQADCRKVLVTLDRCYEVPLFEADLAQLAGSRLEGFIRGMMTPYVKNLARFEGQPGAIVYDALAAYYLLDPGLYALEGLDIVVETRGEYTSGMCVVERRANKVPKPNVEFVKGVDIERFKEGLLGRVRGDKT